MNIKEIAKLAGISVSTVSKIVNGKDENISQETREKVLKIVKEYHYAPYSNIKTDAHRSFLIGVLLSKENNANLLRGISDAASKNGYSIVLCSSAMDNETELKNITVLCNQNIDAVIWDRVNEDSSKLLKYFSEKRIPVYTIDYFPNISAYNFRIDYYSLGYQATKVLIDYKHKKIGCLIKGNDKKAEYFTEGYKNCLYDHGIPYNRNLFQTCDEGFSISDMQLHNMSGVICNNLSIASEVYRQAITHHHKIPNDLSIISLGQEPLSGLMIPPLTVLEEPYYEFGKFICQNIVTMLEKKDTDIKSFNYKVKENGQSVTFPSNLQNRKIVVVGSINIDVIVNVSDFPDTGKTVLADSCVTVPGGKGANQAVGAAKLGADVYLIGRIGKDHDGAVLYDAMNSNYVNMKCVKEDNTAGTGKAYINVKNSGESGIIVYSGANGNLSRRDIDENADVFEGAKFCLLQTEIPYKAVEYAAKIAKEKEVKVILKPAAVKELRRSLLERVDIFLPNEQEANLLCPQQIKLEEKAQYFLDQGVKTVIITLGHRGCYFRDSHSSLYFSSADFAPVDTTGAADAFASALAVYLADGYDMIASIKYATYAAGLSVTRQGVQQALVDRTTLETYADEIQSKIYTSDTLIDVLARQNIK